MMATFPEEPLNLGYFPADIGLALNGGAYTIVRKLGWGSRSSTWLVRQTPDDDEVLYWAAQIFTVDASKDAATRLLRVFGNQLEGFGDWFLNFRAHFVEKSEHGEHVCVIVEPYGLPIVGLLEDAKRSGRTGLPVHVVQYVAHTVLNALSSVHSRKVMHGGARMHPLVVYFSISYTDFLAGVIIDVKVKSVAFTPATQAEWLEPYLESHTPAATVFVRGFPVVRSQPLDNYKPEWDEPMSDVANWMLNLVGYTRGTIQHCLSFLLD